MERVKLMKIIVTGGFGFIGSNFINMLFEKIEGIEIVNVDKMTYAADPSNLDPGINIKSINADISALNGHEDIFSGADCIVNFAAESHVDRSIEDSSSFIESNVKGVHNLLEICRKLDMRFHQVSTDEVYGSLDPEGSDRFTEKTPYNPRNPYSATKASADFLVRAYFNTYGLKTTISNCSNNYGPNQHPEKLIPKSVISALNDVKIPIYGSGLQIRDWIHVSDHCEAIKLILDKGKAGETYLVGADGEKSNLSVVNCILEAMGKPTTLIEFVKDRPGHDERYSIDSSKIRKELGWCPAISFEQGLRSTIDHYINNRRKYERKQVVTK